MVDQHHGMDDVEPLAYEAVWRRLRDGEKLSAVNDGAHLFTFRLRLPITLLALVDCAYLPVGWLKPGARRLEALPRTYKQAPSDAFEREAVYRLFDRDLLQRRMPSAFLLASRDHFDAEHERAYEAAEPDLYRFIIESGFVTHLARIRNCGSLTDGQERVLRGWMTKNARRQSSAPAGEMSKAERDRAETKRAQEELIERRSREREEDPDGIPDGEPDF